MATIQGKVIKVSIDVPVKYAPPKSGTYQGYRIAYEADSGDLREIAKPMTSLKYTPAIREVLESLQPDDEFTLVQEKDEKGYYQIRALAKGRDESAAFTAAVAAGTPAAPTASGGSSRTMVGGRVTGSNYETPEERKLKQRLIVRQAAINQAINIVQPNPGAANSVELVTQVAEEFEAWVYRGLE